KDKAPPQIYRALHWYILLQEKHPEYKSSLWLNTVARPQLTSKELESIKSEVVDQSTNALTKKAIFYLEEENLKRNRLKSEMEDRLGQLTSMKTKLQYLIAFQAILAAAILIIALN
ncbi:MAG: hypothetical protein KDD33_12430, partial [Bdellovibrionales bacterium]|nr:hypothetical protein [Bdellovibrionales bacterium]